MKVSKVNQSNFSIKI